MKELVAHDLRRLRTLLRVVAEHPLHQPDSLRAGPWNNSLQVDLLVFRHGEQFTIGKSACIWPVVNIWFAKDHGDLLKLVHLRRPGEKWLECVEFGHDTPQGEYIDRIVVRAAA